MSATASPKTSGGSGDGGSSAGSNSPAPPPVTPSPRTSRSLQDQGGGNEDHLADTDPEANGTTSRSPPLPPPPIPTTSTPSPSASTSTRDTVTPGPKKQIPEQNEQVGQLFILLITYKLDYCLLREDGWILRLVVHLSYLLVRISFEIFWGLLIYLVNSEILEHHLSYPPCCCPLLRNYDRLGTISTTY